MEVACVIRFCTQSRTSSRTRINNACDNAKEACPTFPNAERMLHHNFDDPDVSGLPPEESQALFIRVRDEVRDWVQGLIKSL